MATSDARKLAQKMQSQGYHLIPDCDNEPVSDYVMQGEPGDGNTAWVQVGDVTIWIRPHDDALIVELCKTSDVEQILDIARVRWEEART